MLTPKQRAVLRMIDAHVALTGVAPSYGEIAEALDLYSRSDAWRVVTLLVERGFLRRIPHRRRALEVIRQPGDLLHELLAACRELISTDNGRDGEFFAAFEAVRRAVARAEREGL